MRVISTNKLFKWVLLSRDKRITQKQLYISLIYNKKKRKKKTEQLSLELFFYTTSNT